ncbi:hypothetical protein [Cupriavidus campinensis]|uniref:Uncharacterized protein n=1 Tax=Cupriavidus campinensis TaxID=151783 RepID=A0AAE9I7E9_9BURK|nr:hypothetical protein [Cupriavidus campinensis]URF05466.1 hypothetical protein M5D45_06580 [Cupriavidus campinensis]
MIFGLGLFLIAFALIFSEPSGGGSHDNFLGWVAIVGTLMIVASIALFASRYLP